MLYRKLLLRRLLLACVLCLGVTVSLRAQGSSDGSLYSRFGLGELQSLSSSQIHAMGGMGQGVRSYNYLNYSNPAAWSDQLLTRGSLGLQYQSVSITNAAGEASRLTSGQLGSFKFSFPLLQRRLGIGLAFAPYSRVNYQVRQEGLFSPSPGAPDTVAYQVDFEGGGGLQQIVGGAGWRPSPHFAVGAHVGFVFGIIENARRTTFPLSADYSGSSLVTATRLAGVNATLGALVSTPRLISEEDMLSVGATITLPTYLSGDRALTLGEGLGRDTLGTTIEGSVDVPWGAGLGAAYYPSRSWLFMAGARYEAWSRFDSDFTFPGYAPGDGETFSDRLHLGGGVEFLPAGQDLLASFFARTGYRVGFYYEEAYVTPAADYDLRTIAATGGLSLPTVLSGTRLDVSLEVGTRGTTDRDLVRDWFYRVSASVNVGERWFQKQKLR